jgi:hypothetical protein
MAQAKRLKRIFGIDFEACLDVSLRASEGDQRTAARSITLSLAGLGLAGYMPGFVFCHRDPTPARQSMSLGALPGCRIRNSEATADRRRPVIRATAVGRNN